MTALIPECSGCWMEKAVGPKGWLSNLSCADCHTPRACVGSPLATLRSRSNPNARLIFRSVSTSAARGVRMQTPFGYESKELLALSAFVAYQSRGVPIQITIDERLKPFFDAGRALFEARQGQLNISCAQCHDDNWGKRMAGNIIPQAQPNGYPVYRLEWQELGSLQRRLRNCLIGMRAETYPYGAIEYIELELYMAWRANGLENRDPCCTAVMSAGCQQGRSVSVGSAPRLIR